MKCLIILTKIIIFIVLFYLIFISPEVEAEVQGKYFLMTITAYSLHENCIADKWNDGYTATMTPIREGVAAINVDYIDGEWEVRSPLKLGDEIHIEGLGNFSVEDTGYFTDKNYKQDFWNVDIYMEDYNEAVEFGRQLKKVYVLEGK